MLAEKTADISSLNRKCYPIIEIKAFKNKTIKKCQIRSKLLQNITRDDFLLETFLE